MKCPKEEKEKFLSVLMEFLTHVMKRSVRDISAAFAGAPMEESVAKWHFFKMDTNRNGEVSRKELRPLRRLLSRHRSLRRCGKRIQLHCDPDESKTITESEWVRCVTNKGK